MTEVAPTSTCLPEAAIKSDPAPAPVTPDTTSLTTKAPLASSRSRRRSRTSSSSRSRSRSPYRRDRHRCSRSRNRDQSGRFNRRERRRSSLTPPYRPRPYGYQPRGRSPRGYFQRRRRSGSRDGGGPHSHRQRWNPVWVGQGPRNRQRYSPTIPKHSIIQDEKSPTIIQPDSPNRRRVSPDTNPPPPELLTLTERFQRLVGKVETRRPEYGLPGGYAHLILSNRLQIPLPTLMRQAKELSVVIERELPPGIANPSVKIIFEFDPRRSLLVLPHSTNQKTGPIFDRPEIPVYTKPEDEDAIVSRLAAFMSAKAGEIFQHSAQNRPHKGGNVGFPFSQQKKGSALSRIGSINPLDIPKGPSYFLHDDRDAPLPYRGRSRGGGYTNRDDWRQGREFDRNRTHRNYSPNGRRDRTPSPSWDRRGGQTHQEDRWKHDKFLELASNEESSSPGKRSPSTRSCHLVASEIAMEEDVHIGAEPQVCDD